MANVQLMEEDFLSWSMDEIEMKQKLGKEIKAVTGDEAIQKTSRNVLQRRKLNRPLTKQSRPRQSICI